MNEGHTFVMSGQILAAKQKLTYRRIALGGLVLVLAVLAYAWIDGGEEPVRPISQVVAVPESAR